VFHRPFRQLAAVTANLAFCLAPAVRRSIAAASATLSARAGRLPSGVVFHHHVLKEARLKRQGRNLSQRAVLFARALIFVRAGLAVGRISLFMALLSRRADNYRLKASNAAPPLSTMTATLRCLKMKHSSLSTSATNCCNLFVVETRLFGFKACDVSVCALL
jgi:hypothetical protein